MKFLEEKKDGLIKVFLLFYAIIMLNLCMSDTPHPFGEWDDYTLMTVSFINEGDITISDSDVNKAKEMFSSLATAYDNYRLSGWYAKDGNEMAWYFPTYSLCCIPMIIALKILNVPLEYAFQLTNLGLLLMMLFILLKNRKLDDKIKVYLILLLSVNPIVFYITSMSAEVFIYVFISLGMLYWHNKEYKKAAVMISLAGTMNIVIMFCGIVMILEYLLKIWTKSGQHSFVLKIKSFLGHWKEIVSYGCCYIIGLIPMIYFYYNTGHINLTAGYENFTVGTETTIERFWAYLTDWNFGFLPYYNILFLFSIVLIIVAVGKKNFSYLEKMVVFYGIVFLYSIMVHINHGMLGIARYNVWNAVILIWAVCIFVEDIIAERNKRNAFLRLPGLITCFLMALIIWIYGPMGASNTSYTKMTPIASLILDKAPALYHPLGSTFCSRVTGIDGGYLYSTPLYYTDTNGNIKKILAKKEDAQRILSDVSGEEESINWLIQKLEKLSWNESYVNIPDGKKIRKLIYSLGTDMNFCEESNYVVSGISVGETDDYVWTNGNSMKMKYKIDDVGYQYVHAIFETAHVYDLEQTVIIFVNGEEVYNNRIREGEDLEFDFRMPDDGIVEMEMQFPEAVSPKEKRESEDERKLALGLRTAAFVGYDKESLEISFAGENRNAEEYVTEGVSGNEGDFAWTDGNRVVMMMDSASLDAKTGDQMYVVFNLDGIWGESQLVKIYINEQYICEKTVKNYDDLYFGFTKQDGDIIRIELELPDAVAPAELSADSADIRKLALKLETAKIIVRED